MRVRVPAAVAAVSVVPLDLEEAPYDPRKHGAACHICPLKGNVVVPPKPSYLPTRLVLVGEAPGRKEEFRGVPFVGQTGVFLKSLLREVDIDVREAHLTNSSLCRSNIDKENEAAAVCCAPRLLRELAALPASAPIVALGKASALSVLGTKSIMHARGFVWTAREVDPAPAVKAWRKAKASQAPKTKELHLKAQIAQGRALLAGRTVFPTIHPAFVLRSDTWRPVLKVDLDRVARWLRGELTHDRLLDQGPYVVVSKRKDVRRELKKLGDTIAVDIETAPSTPGGKDGADPHRNKMLCVGLSDGDHTVVIWPWRGTHAPLVNACFRRVKTIGMHNGYNFDQISLKRHDVPFEVVDDKLEDTLIAHHTFASHMPQRLAHVASIYVDVGPWKITFKRGGGEEKGLPPEKLSGEELCRYNAADARIQARVWLELQADLESERHVYAVDKENARLTRSMGIVGIGVDTVRRDLLIKRVGEKAERLEHEMRALLRRPNFHPMQLAEVRRALFTTLRAPLSAADPTESGVPSTSSKTLERLKHNPTRAGKFATQLLEWRGAVKIKSTYLQSQILDKPARGSTIARTHFNWRSYGAACMPAGELVLTDRGYIEVQDVRVGDQVIAHTGVPRRVTQTFANPAAPIYKVELANGLVLRTTADHRYRSADGRWIRADRLRIGQTVLAHSDPEEWRHLSDWPYEVSSWGRVRHCGRLKPMSFTKVKPYGHLKVKLCKEVVDDPLYRKELKIHRLVLTAFGRLPSGLHARHVSGIPWDNTLTNLVAGTNYDNRQDSWLHGTVSKRRRPDPQRKLTEADAERIRQESRDYYDDVRLGKELGVCREVVRDIRLRKRWLPETHIIGKRAQFKPVDVVAVTREQARVNYGLNVEIDSSHVTGGIVTHNSGRYSCRLQSCPRCENLKKWAVGSDVLLASGGRETVGAVVLKALSGGRALIRVEGTGVELEVAGKDLRPVVLETRVREVYVARPGCKLVYFDLSQAELRLAAYLSGDEVYIAMCESGDVHTTIAQVLFPEEAETIRTDPKGVGKPFRDVEKNSIFGFQYFADPTTIFTFVQAKGFDIVRMKDVLRMRDLIHEKCAEYFRWVEKNKRFTDKHGYYRCPISGRISWLGWHAGYPDVANRPIQKGIASIMNVRLPRIWRALPKGASVVAQIHDAAILEVPDKHVDAVAGRVDEKGKRVGGLVSEVWAEPVVIPAGGYGSSLRVEDGARSFVMPIDKKVGERWSDFG